MKRLKVVHISEAFAGGVYLYIKEICRFTEENYDVQNFVIFSGKRQGTDFNKFPEDFSKSTTLIKVDMEREISLLKDFNVVLKVSKIVKEILPDVIHSHSSKGGAIGRIVAKKYGRAKSFYTPNGYSFLRKDISKFKQSIFKFSELFLSYFMGATTIACGDTEYDYAKRMGKATLIRNAVNVEEVSKHQSKKKSDRMVIGTIGRLSPQKNPFLFNAIAEKYKEVDFVWVGDGKLKSRLISENIKITGWLNREQTLTELGRFDIYIQTSLWEGLPFTIIEAMALRKPIVATNIVGNKDAVSNWKNGFLCDSQEDFINSIKQLIENESQRKKMANHSLILVNELFNQNKNLKKLFKVYKD
ncbi:glycosyltransferase family 4 protein [Seonamhaeicola sediminis]|uniref:Glycosyltransferase family 4 protein n=1 Tax=Seonamhaeicola sediminis TaxID=2528206 RepID=A0A562YHA1_9FLAO|nr:glycosyltransferase [Seonamhaeicola sediminis]TWO34422.1 glycosyltransferase family 4 protein [Seonamhaeicola sediminis]